MSACVTKMSDCLEILDIPDILDTLMPVAPGCSMSWDCQDIPYTCALMPVLQGCPDILNTWTCVSVLLTTHCILVHNIQGQVSNTHHFFSAPFSQKKVILSDFGKGNFNILSQQWLKRWLVKAPSIKRLQTFSEVAICCRVTGIICIHMSWGVAANRWATLPGSSSNVHLCPQCSNRASVWDVQTNSGHPVSCTSVCSIIILCRYMCVHVLY